MFATYFVVAVISGQLTARVRAQERNERMREDRATALLHLTQALSAPEVARRRRLCGPAPGGHLLRGEDGAAP